MRLFADTVSKFTSCPATVTWPLNVCPPLVFTFVLFNAIVCAVTLSDTSGLLLPNAWENVTTPVPAVMFNGDCARLVSLTYGNELLVGFKSFH